MKERPVLFNSQMVRAVLRGMKTQTRRVVRGSSAGDVVAKDQIGTQPNNVWWLRDVLAEPGSSRIVRCPLGEPGDRLWVRETWAVPPGSESRGDVAYRADIPEDAESDERWARRTCTQKASWSPSIHMPRWASRIALEVTAVRAERLCRISEADAVAEGVHKCWDGFDGPRYAGQSSNPGEWRDPRRAFAAGTQWRRRARGGRTTRWCGWSRSRGWEEVGRWASKTRSGTWRSGTTASRSTGGTWERPPGGRFGPWCCGSSTGAEEDQVVGGGGAEELRRGLMGHWDFFEDDGKAVPLRDGRSVLFRRGQPPILAPKSPKQRKPGRKKVRETTAEGRIGAPPSASWCSACGKGAVLVGSAPRCPSGCGEGSEEFGGAWFVMDGAQAFSIRGERHP